MDLQQEWANMESEIHKVAAPIAYSLTVQKESKGIMKTLIKNLHYKKNWTRVFSILALLGVVFTQDTLRYLLLGIFLVYELTHLLMSQKLKNLDLEINYSEATKTVLMKQLELVKQILKMEQIWGYVFMPLAGPVGYFVSKLALGGTMDTIIHSPNFPKQILLCLLVSGLGLPLASWMNKVAFGNYIKDLTHKLENYKEDSLG